MSNKDQHAFPQSQEMWGGLTKREWFAGMAMQGLLANKTFMEQLSADMENDEEAYSNVAEFSYKIADAMFEEHNEKL